MVGRLEGGLAIGLAVALSLTAACRKPAPGDDCQPPGDEQLAQFLKLQGEGVALYQRQQPEPAIVKLEEARALNPCDASIYNDLGIAWHQRRQPARAIELLRKGVELDPLYALAHLNLGIIYEETGEMQGALTEFERFANLNPDFAEAHRRIGTLYFKLGKVEPAKAALERAQRIEPGDPEVALVLGKIAVQENQLERAVELFRTAVDGNHDSPEAIYALGTALASLGRDAEARPLLARFEELSRHQKRIEDLQRTLDQSPAQAPAVLPELAREYTALGRDQDALQALERALVDRPKDPELLLAAAEAKVRLKAYGEAIVLAERAQETTPDSMPASDLIMSAAAAERRFERAIEEITAVRARHPEYTKALLNLAILEQGRGHAREALAAIDSYLASDPKSVLAREIRVDVYLHAADPALRDPERAFAAALEAEKLGSQRFELLAEAYAGHGNTDRARSALERALQQPGSDQVVLKDRLAQLERTGP